MAILKLMKNSDEPRQALLELRGSLQKNADDVCIWAAQVTERVTASPLGVFCSKRRLRVPLNQLS